MANQVSVDGKKSKENFFTEIFFKVHDNYYSKGSNDSIGKSSFPEQCIGLVYLL